MAIFQSLWFGDRLPPYQQLATKSFVDYGHEYVLYAYKSFDVPPGVALRDANNVLAESRVFFYGDRAGVGRGSIAGFSNLFRYHLLHRMGNWWVDTDVVCLSDKVPSDPIFLGWEPTGVIGNAILKFPEHHEFVRGLRDSAESTGADVMWGTTGPLLLTRLAKERELLDLVSPHSLAYPIRSIDALRLLIPAHRDELSDAIRNKPFLHFWNETLRRAVILPWMAPPPGSLMAELCARHGVDFSHSPVYTADQIQRIHDNLVTPGLLGEMETLLDQIRAQKVDIGVKEGHIRALETDITTLLTNICVLQASIAALQASNSWRVTASLRQIAVLLRDCRKRLKMRQL